LLAVLAKVRLPTVHPNLAAGPALALDSDFALFIGKTT